MKINLNNPEKLDAILDERQNGSKVRRMSMADVLSAAIGAEEKLEDLGVPKKYRQDCVVHMLPEAVANSYKYTATGTGALLKRFTSGWFIVALNREPCRSCSGGASAQNRLTLSVDAKLHTPEHYLV